MPEVAVFTPVRGEREQALRETLRRLYLAAQGPQRASPGAPLTTRESPFTQLAGGTHFARLVVIDTGGRWCRSPHLLFTSRFDGDRSDYFAAFAATREALEIWRHCERPTPLTARTLSDYLLNRGEDHVPASYVVSAFPASATVAHINAALELRAQLACFATEAKRMDAVTLTQAFRECDAIQRLQSP